MRPNCNFNPARGAHTATGRSRRLPSGMASFSSALGLESRESTVPSSNMALFSAHHALAAASSSLEVSNHTALTASSPPRSAHRAATYAAGHSTFAGRGGTAAAAAAAAAASALELRCCGLVSRFKGRAEGVKGLVLRHRYRFLSPLCDSIESSCSGGGCVAGCATPRSRTDIRVQLGRWRLCYGGCATPLEKRESGGEISEGL